MSYSLHPEAEREFLEAIAYYEERETDLASVFGRNKGYIRYSRNATFKRPGLLETSAGIGDQNKP